MENPGTLQRRKERELAEHKKELAGKNDVLDTLFVLDNPHGRRFLRWLLKTCRMDAEAADPTSSKVYMNLGMQKVGREITARLKEASTEKYVLLLKEIEDDVKSKSAAKGNANVTED